MQDLHFPKFSRPTIRLLLQRLGSDVGAVGTISIRRALTFPGMAPDPIVEPWVELLENIHAVGVRDRLIELGIEPERAAGIAMWLYDIARSRVIVGESTAADYRQTLALLDT